MITESALRYDRGMGKRNVLLTVGGIVGFCAIVGAVTGTPKGEEASSARASADNPHCESAGCKELQRGLPSTFPGVEVRDEGSTIIVYKAPPTFCTGGGKCWVTNEACTRISGAEQCTETANYACFGARKAMTGEAFMSCFSGFDACRLGRLKEPDVTDVTECIVMRGGAPR